MSDHHHDHPAIAGPLTARPPLRSKVAAAPAALAFATWAREHVAAFMP
ncbi:hypothetical protein AB0G05_16455 [Nonomuraea wenchangensis]